MAKTYNIYFILLASITVEAINYFSQIRVQKYLCIPCNSLCFPGRFNNIWKTWLRYGLQSLMNKFSNQRLLSFHLWCNNLVLHLRIFLWNLELSVSQRSVNLGSSSCVCKYPLTIYRMMNWLFLCLQTLSLHNLK